MAKKQVVVIGLGRFGSGVARSLYNLGHDVLAMDVNDDRVQSMMGQVTYPVSGNATNETVLKELGVPDYDAAVVAVGSDIPGSVMACVLLKTMEIPYIVARATIKRGKDVTLNPDIDDMLRSGDMLILAGRDELLERLPS